MNDPKLYRQNWDETAAALERRGFRLDKARFQELEERRKLLQTEVQQLQNVRNSLSKEVGFLKQKKQDASELMEKLQLNNRNLDAKEKELDEALAKLQQFYLEIPNIPHVSVPDGLSEDDNVEQRRVGEIPTFDFAVRSHDELGAALGMMDFESAAKITGARFVVLSGDLARLQRALTQFMLDLHTKKHGYREFYVPHMVNSDSLLGTGQLPKFKADLFNMEEASFGYSLIPTAEVPLTNLVRGEILNFDQLPLKMTAHTPCYRSEAGSYGKDMKGMIRQHQFEKVELVRVVRPEDSYAALEELTHDAEEVLQLLELPYRVVALCGGDLGACSAKTYDLEVWLPSQNRYREISSCSNMESFQARRMMARYRKEDGTTDYVHTLNGSGVAVGRALVAILENGQDAEGNIRLPYVLTPYLDGQTVIRKP